LSCADRVIALSQVHTEHQLLILLVGLSIAWLEPQNPDAAKLLAHYKTQQYSFSALREAALQLFLLAGFQASLEAAFQTEQVFGHGLNEDDIDERQQLSSEQLHTIGRELQATVYRGNVEKLRANLRNVSVELADWTVRIGYGLVLSRPGMPAHWRDLLEVAVLAVQGFPRQLHSHLRGALNLGASPNEIDLVLEAARESATKERYDAALQMWRKIQQSL